MASTYVNDLRLNELATGDGAGTWGTTTNTNLELIGEALGYGTEAITTNADTHTTTVADGASDPGRAMYLEYTGTLDSACTITIAPNTLSRMHFIENGTSGSQNIIISQGSGANITIPPGDTKAVYLDGAGSGAAVVDAFASLSVVDLKVQDDLTVTDDMTVGGDIDLEGSIDVNGTANLDVVDIDGAVNMATTALVTGVLTTTAATVFNGGFASNADSTMGTNKKIQFRDAAIHISSSADGQLDLVADTEIQIAATTVDLNGNFDVSGTAVVAGVVTANAGVVVDEITIDGDTITATDEFIIDAASHIKLDADSGNIIFRDAGTNFSKIINSSGDVLFSSETSDKDIKFNGNDGGSGITALVLDMSNGGSAVFNKDIFLSDNSVLRLGGAEDLKIFHDGSNNYLRGNTSDQDLIFQGNDGGSIITALTLDMSAAGKALFNSGAAFAGNVDFADNAKIVLGAGDDGFLYSDGTNVILDVAGDIILDAGGGDFDFKVGGTEIGSIIQDGNNMQIKSSISDGDMIFRGNDGGSIISALTLDMSAAGKAVFNSGAAFAGNVDFADNAKIVLGAGDDGLLYSDGTNVILDVSGDITFDADGDEIFFKRGGVAGGRILMASTMFAIGSQENNGDFKIMGIDGGADIDALTFDMSDAGTAIFNHDIQMADSALIRMGAGGDLILTSDGTNGAINANEGNLSFDVAGGIILDSDAGTFTFSDAGTRTLLLDARGNLYFGNVVSSPAISQFFNGITGNYGGHFLTQNNGVPVTSIGNNFYINNSTQNVRVLERAAQNFKLDHLGNFLFQSLASGAAGETNFTLIERMRLDIGGRLSIGTTGGNAGITASTDIRAMGASFANDANSITMSQESGFGAITARGPSTSERGVLKLSVNRSNGGGGIIGLQVNNDGSVTVAGALSKGSGSFKIDHPLESKKETHNLVHSFIEGPQADNIYRGVTTLVNGSATINIDTVSGMTEGTYVLLNTNTSCFTSNETDWDAVKGSVSGNTLTITCQNSSSTATVSWLVIGERQDQHMIDTEWTDDNGKVIVEPLKETE